MKKILATGLIVAVAVFVTATSLFAAEPNFPYEDVNNNGAYDPAIDKNIKAAIMDDGIYVTPNSIVIPKGVGSLTAPKKNYSQDFILKAGQNIIVNASLYAARIFLITDEGDITIGPAVILRAADIVQIYSKNDIDVLARASIQCTGLYGYCQLLAENSICLMEGSQVNSQYNIRINAGFDNRMNPVGTGEFVMKPGAKLMTNIKSGSSHISIGTVGNMEIEGCQMQAELFQIWTKGHYIEFCNNAVSLPRYSGLVILSAEGSTVDITGSKFINLSPSDLIIYAEEIIK